MSSGSRRIALIAGVSLAAAALAVSVHATRQTAPRQPVFLDASTHHAAEVPAVADPRVLRVCADPNNMPFSNSRGEGFENRIAALVAGDLGRTVSYTWRPQRRGFIRTTLKAGQCDLVMGVPATFDPARTTRPYYRSTYVFVARRGDQARVRSLDDPRMKRLRIGIQITGEDYENPPPAQALAARRLTRNVRGYTVYGDYSQADPQRGVIDAVAGGDVDVAIVWGPLAGYFARREPVRLSVTPVAPRQDGPLLPFVFDIAMGVRRGDRALGDAVDGVIARRGTDIRRILAAYGVPLIDMEGGH